MPTDVIMPQMGESIFEGTLTKWLKKPGDKVQRDEPLFEISTDKVDAEIPAPASGVLQDIKVTEGTTVQVNTVVAVIGDGAGAAAGAPAPQKPAPAAEKPAAPQPATPAQPAAPQQAAAAPPPAAQAPAAPSAPQAQPPAPQQQAGVQAAGEKVRSSPLVRKIAREHNVDVASVGRGSGMGGRITKDDILNFIEKGGAGAAQGPAQGTGSQSGAAQGAPSLQPSPQAAAPVAQVGHGTPGTVEPMSKMRSIIAQRMVESKRTSAHVHTCFKVDMTRIVNIRNKQKNGFEQRNGVKLTFMPFVARAIVAGMKQWPIVNASVEGEAIRYHRNVNLGIAVALDWGLIVPVIKAAEEKSFLGIARAIQDLAERARSKRLQPDEIQGGTFTLTNPGSFGEMFGTPIISQPQVGILGTGGLYKEPMVVTDADGNDSIAIRSTMHLTLGFDHRIVDGADAGKFMAVVKKYLENWSEEIG